MATHQNQHADPGQESATKRQTPRSLDQELATLTQRISPGMVRRPEQASPGEILMLQRVVGNRTISGLIQAKLNVGPVGDQYEQEADRVADRVMRTPAPNSATFVRRQEVPEEEELQMKPLATTDTSVVQRQEVPEEEELQMKPLAATDTSVVQRQEVPEEEELQMKPLAATDTSVVQRQEMPEEEELQMKPQASSPVIQRKPRGGFQASNDIEQQLRLLRGNGNPLPDGLRTEMEARFGVDFDAVRLHTGGEAGQLNQNLRARAFTHGTDIYLGSNEPDFDTGAGKRLLAHELTHVVQQTGGRNLPATQSAKSAQGGDNHTIQRNGPEEEDPFHDPMHPTMSPLVNKRPPERTEEDPFHDPMHPTMSPLVNKRPPDPPAPAPPSKWARFKGKFSSGMKRRLAPDLGVSSALRQQSRGTTGGLLQGPGVGTRKALSARPESEGGRKWKQQFAEPEEEKGDSDMVKMIKELLEQLKGGK